MEKYRLQKHMCVINDLLGQTQSPVSSYNYSQLKVILFCEILKSGQGRTDRHQEWK